jgi:hypothetical protein
MPTWTPSSAVQHTRAGLEKQHFVTLQQDTGSIVVSNNTHTKVSDGRIWDCSRLCQGFDGEPICNLVGSKVSDPPLTHTFADGEYNANEL